MRMPNCLVCFPKGMPLETTTIYFMLSFETHVFPSKVWDVIVVECFNRKGIVHLLAFFRAGISRNTIKCGWEILPKNKQTNKKKTIQNWVEDFFLCLKKWWDRRWDKTWLSKWGLLFEKKKRCNKNKTGFPDICFMFKGFWICFRPLSRKT